MAGSFSYQSPQRALASTSTKLQVAPNMQSARAAASLGSLLGSVAKVYSTSLEEEAKTSETEAYVEASNTFTAISEQYSKDSMEAGANVGKQDVAYQRLVAMSEETMQGLSVDNQSRLVGHKNANERNANNNFLNIKLTVDREAYSSGMSSTIQSYVTQDPATQKETYLAMQAEGEALGLSKTEIGTHFTDVHSNFIFSQMDMEKIKGDFAYEELGKTRKALQSLAVVDPKNKKAVDANIAKLDKLKDQVDSNLTKNLNLASTVSNYPLFEKLLTTGYDNGVFGKEEAYLRFQQFQQTLKGTSGVFNDQMEAWYAKNGTPNLSNFSGKEATWLNKKQKGVLIAAMSGKGFNPDVLSKNAAINPELYKTTFSYHMNDLNGELRRVMQTQPKTEEGIRQKEIDTQALLKGIDQTRSVAYGHLEPKEDMEIKFNKLLATGRVGNVSEAIQRYNDKGAIPLASTQDNNIVKLKGKVGEDGFAEARMEYSALVFAGVDKDVAYDEVEGTYSYSDVEGSKLSVSKQFKTALSQAGIPVGYEGKALAVLAESDDLSDATKASLQQVSEGENPTATFSNGILTVKNDNDDFFQLPLSPKVLEGMANVTREQNRKDGSFTGVTKVVDDAMGFASNEVSRFWEDMTDIGKIISAPITEPLNGISKMAGMHIDGIKKSAENFNTFVEDVYSGKMTAEQARSKWLQSSVDLAASAVTREVGNMKLDGSKFTGAMKRSIAKTKSLIDSGVGAYEAFNAFTRWAMGITKGGEISELGASQQLKTQEDSMKTGNTAGSVGKPYKNIAEMRSSGSLLTGQSAIARVEELEQRRLSYSERRVVEEEGFVDGYYLDSKKVLTYGVGQTKGYIEKGFHESFKAHQDDTKRMIPKFEKLPEYLRAELVQATYRGDLQGSDKARTLFNSGKYDEAATEFLDNQDYRDSKKSGSGIAKRMEKVANAIRKYGYANYT